MPKHGRDQFRALPAEFPGREVLSLPKGRDDDQEYSCVSVYAAVPFKGPAGALVRVNLFASLLNIRALVASAIVPQNFTGPVIHVAGFLADAYAVYLQATSPDAEGFIAMRADTCCATPGVFVPIPLQNPVPIAIPEFATLIAEPPAPNQIVTGLYELFTEDSTPGGILVIPAGMRILSIAIRASGAADGTVTIAGGTTGSAEFIVEQGETGQLEPLGTLVGPLVLTFTNFEHFAVETVR